MTSQLHSLIFSAYRAKGEKKTEAIQIKNGPLTIAAHSPYFHKSLISGVRIWNKERPILMDFRPIFVPCLQRGLQVGDLLSLEEELFKETGQSDLYGKWSSVEKKAYSFLHSQTL